MPKTTKRPGYREAIEWIAHNDDCTWLDDEYPALSVPLALVADLWGKSEDEATRDLRRKIAKLEKLG